MGSKPTYEELQKKVGELTQKAVELERVAQEPQDNLSVLETLINTIPAPVFYKNKQGVYRGCNQAFAGQILGLNKEKIIGLSLFDLPEAIPPDLAQIYHQKDNELIENPGTQFYEAQVQCADGPRRDFLFNKATYTDNQGNVAGMIGVMIDITDTRRSERALRESESRYRNLFENMSDGVAIYKAVNEGEDFIFIDFNRAGEKIEKVKKKGLVGKSVLKIFPGVKDFGILDAFRRVWKTGKPEHFPIAFYKDNRISGWRNNYIYKLDSGEIVAVYSDETARKQTEEALRMGEERFRTVANFTYNWELWRGADGRFIYVSPSCERISGYSAEEFMADPELVFKIIHPEDKAKAKKHFKICSSEKSGTEHLELRIINKNGKEVWIGHTCTPVYGKDNQWMGRRISNRDISERKYTEEALKKSEERFRLLASISPAGIYMTDAKGDTVYVNESWCKMAGLSPQEASGRGWVKAIHPDDRKRTAANWYKMVASQGQWGVEYRFLTPDGKINWVYGIATEIKDENGAVIGYMGTNININDRKEMEAEKAKLEAQLQQAQKMEAIGTLAGGIAHDFNNILAPIIGCTEMSLEDVASDTFLYENLQAVLKAGMRAKELVQQILAFSRQADQELKPLRVQTIIKEVLKLCRSTLPTTIQIQQQISNHCGLVMADPTQIHQIAMNLITNAYHAMEEHGGILSVTLEEADQFQGDMKGPDIMTGPYVCLTVSDSGVGMEKSIMERIFEPYFTTKEKEKGTGLGLSVVHGIAKSHGGDISVHSQPGKGTSFQVYLPVIKTKTETLETEVMVPFAGGNERILFVDDEVQIVHMLKQMIERLGYQVTARTSSIEALEVFRKTPDQFDLVITDMTMPNMTGVQLAQKLFKIRPDIPVIICSGFSDKIDEHKAKELGIRGYVMKPVVKRELTTKIREALDRGD